MVDFTTVIKTIAPWIGTALGGPLGGMAIEAAASAFGLNDKTISAVKSAISGATPEQMFILKKADQEFAIQMQTLGFKELTDLESIAAGDRKDARGMQTTNPSSVPAILSSFVTIGYFGVLVGIMKGYLSIDDSQALLLMLGSLTTAWGAVMSFWFGTTRDSSRKTEIIAKSGPIN
jgi:hypothetical protein